jgi:DNA-binding transcriptional LysR family regulator
MEDHRLRAFCLIVETQSFSKAAEAKNMTQSAMSHLIRNLEDELEVKLLSRGARNVLPTSAGRVLYGHAKRILDEYRQMDRDMEGLSKDVRGRLRLGATQTIAAFLLPQLLYDFLRLHPSARVHLSVFNNDGVIRELREGGLDIGIIESTLKDKSLAAERFAEDEMVVVAAEDNPLAREKHITANDLLSQPFILPETGSGTRESIDDWFKHLGIDPAGVKEILTVGSPELLVQLVQSGLGISVVSKWSAFRPVKEGALKVLPVAGRRWTRRFYIVSRDGEPSTFAARTLKDFVKSYRFFAPF